MSSYSKELFLQHAFKLANSKDPILSKVILNGTQVFESRFAIGSSSRMEDVHVEKIVGSNHSNYSGNDYRWCDLLSTGKNMSSNLDLFFREPKYYFGNSFDNLTLTTYDNGVSYYVSSDGNHRVAIAKAYFALSKKKLLPDFFGSYNGTMRNVRVIHVAIDQDFCNIVKTLISRLENTNLKYVLPHNTRAKFNLSFTDHLGNHKTLTTKDQVIEYLNTPVPKNITHAKGRIFSLGILGWIYSWLRKL
jgi:hypothetical protein